MRHQGLLTIGLWMALGLTALTVDAAPTRNIYIVAGPSSIYHAPVGHDYQASSIIWTNRLVQRGHNLNVTLLAGWPSNVGIFSNADAIVLYSEGGGSHEDGSISHEIIRNGRWDKAMQIINRGVSFGGVHYAVEPPGAAQNWPGIGSSTEQYGTNEYSKWLGGYYVGWYVNAHPPSWNNTFIANLSFPSHTVNQGISYAGFDDEWYANIYFPQTVQPFLQCNNHPNGGGTQTIGWTFDRADGARGFGFTGGHFTPGSWFSGSSSNNLSLLLNAIEWLGKVGEEDRHEVLIRSGSTWKYDADGSMDSNWNTPGFNDGSWSSGAAPLGYDDWSQDWVGTTIPAGSSGNRPITTWFRRTFNVPTLNNVTNFLVKINADDGAVVYLNGTEIGRYNMPGGAVTASTTASNSPEVNWTTTFDTACPYNQAQWDGFDQSTRDYYSGRVYARNVAMTNSSTPEFNWGRILGGSALQQGNNVLAIEVHQIDSSNPDMRLDVEASLLGNNSFIPGDTSTVTSAPAISVSAATAIGYTTATLNGSLTSTGTLPTSVRFVWAASDAGTNLASWANSTNLGLRTVGSVSANIASLNGGSGYSFRAYASNSFGVTWSSVGTFTTKPTNFIAYNDVSWEASQPSNKITTYTVLGTSGALIDYTTGASLDAQVSISSSNGFYWSASAAGVPPVGTPAAQLLPSNIISSLHHCYFDSASMTITGLSPTLFYSVVLYANRDGDPFSGTYTSRYTTVTISGATSFENNSTTGTVNQAATSSTIKSGVAHGEIFRFDQINPGADGAVTFALGGLQPCLNSFMVMTPSISGTNNPPSGGTSNLITMGDSWLYHNDGTLPASNWTATTYGEPGWSTGVAPLGYDDPAIATTLLYGGDANNKWVTYYFRKHFTVTNLASVTGMLAQYIADDGAVFYLNGNKIHTSTNLPLSGVDNSTLAASFRPEPYSVYTFTVNPASLVMGDNVLAVELHQSGFNSSDLYFDMDLARVAYATTNQPGGLSTNAPATPSDWTAFNDTMWNGANETYNNSYSTNSPTTGVNGPLMTTNGEVLSASVSFNTASAVTLASVTVTNVALPPGTDAYNVFNGRVGHNNVSDWASGFVTMTLSGLNTSKQYSVVLFCSRLADNTQYTDRWTVVTISSVDAFANNSSTAAPKSTTTTANDTTRLSAGLLQGLVARYDSVRPGADGTIAFSLTGTGTNGQSHGYINAFMVVESPVTAGGDTDTDGMPDTWEQTYFGGTSTTNGGIYQDADGDGVLNIEEFIAGSSPTSSSSGPMLDHTTLTNGMMKFDMLTVTGRIYYVDFRSNLGSAVWQNYTSFVGNGSAMGITNTRVDPRYFYRFRVRMENP